MSDKAGTPKKRARGRPKSKENFGSFNGFLNCYLNKQDEEKLAAMDLGEEFPLSDLPVVVGWGYKVTFSYSEYSQSFVCTMTDKVPDSPFENWAISGGGSSVEDAFASLLYKHRVKGVGGWELNHSRDSTKRFG